jgi:hypothetical protein
MSSRKTNVTTASTNIKVDERARDDPNTKESQIFLNKNASGFI